MSSVIQPIIHNTIAESIYSDLISRSNRYFYFVGKTLDFETTDLDETPNRSYRYELATRKEISVAKQITASDVSFVVPRINWVSGTVYDDYDDAYCAELPATSGATSLDGALFYVMTDEFNVYKCLSNRGGIPSTVKPTGTDAVPFVTGDGYKWKFLFNVPLGLRVKFLTENLMPVSNLITERFYNDGALTSITIVDGGTGYDYTPATTLAVDGDGDDAELEPVIINGAIVGVRVINPGTGYTSATITVDGDGSGIYDNTDAVLDPIIYEGEIVGAAILDPGTGYSSGIDTVIEVTGDGSGAELYPVIDENGEIVDVIMASGGSGYTFANITVSGQGSGAQLTASFSTGEVASPQANSELLTVPGTIDNIKVTNSGSGYNSIPSVTITGDGTGATATAVIQGGTVTRINVTNRGSGYTFANVVIAGSGGATARAIMSPIGGHGSNPINELFAKILSFYTTLNFDFVEGFEISNDYRQFGIIKNPTRVGLPLKRVTNSIITPAYRISGIFNEADFLHDDILLIGDKRYAVVEKKEGSLLIISLDNESPAQGNIIVNERNSIQFGITSVGEPTMNKYSGEILFIDNRPPFSQSEDQTVTFRTTFKF